MGFIGFAQSFCWVFIGSIMVLLWFCRFCVSGDFLFWALLKGLGIIYPSFDARLDR